VFLSSLKLIILSDTGKFLCNFFNYIIELEKWK
jgi:hypothetical protein